MISRTNTLEIKYIVDNGFLNAKGFVIYIYHMSFFMVRGGLKI
jgi:hypothetical protein